MNTSETIKISRLKRITSMVENKNKKLNQSHTQGYKTQKEIVKDYINKYKDDPSLTQGKLSKLIKETKFLQKNSNDVFVLENGNAKYESVKGAYKKANAKLMEVKEFAIEVDGNIVELLRVLERNFYDDIYDVTFNKKTLTFKTLIEPEYYVDDNNLDYNSILSILMHIDGKLHEDE